MKKKINKTVIIMGYTCNNKCIFCCNEDKRNKVKEKLTEEIKKDILDAKKKGANYLELIGGEPTIRKDIIKILKFANKVGFDTIMFATNGRMFSNFDFSKKVIDSGLNHVVFSIHGYDGKTHDELVGVKGSFNQLIKGIKNLQKLGLKNIGSNTTIVKQNYKDLIKIGELIYKLGIKNSEFIFVDPNQGAPKNRFKNLVPTYEEISPYINKLLEFGKEKKNKHWHIRYYPLCFVDEDYHDMISENLEKEIFETEHIAPDFINRNVYESRKNIGRMKIKKCENCIHNKICEGYWKEYVNNMLKNKT